MNWPTAFAIVGAIFAHTVALCYLADRRLLRTRRKPVDGKYSGYTKIGDGADPFRHPIPEGTWSSRVTITPADVP